MTCLRLEPRRPLTAAVMVLLLALGGGCAEPSQDPFWEMRELYERGQYAESLAQLRSLEPEQAGNPEFDLLYAKVLIETRRPSLAREPLERAAASAEHALQATTLLVTALLRAEEFPEALAAADRALALEPNDATAWQLRGRANLAMGRSKEALADIERALDLDPDQQKYALSRVLVLLSLRRFDEAAVVLNHAKRRLEETPDPSKQIAASLCVAEARLVLGAGDRRNAGEQIDRCVESFPANPFVVGEALDLFDSLDQPERALRVLRGAIEAWPEHSRYYAMLAGRLREQGRAEEVERFLLQKLESSPSMAAWSALAQHYQDQADPARAAAAYREALELAGESGAGAARSLRFAYADLLLQIGDYDEARRVIEGFGDVADADLLRGRMLLIEGDARGALEALERGIRVWPKNAVAHYLAGQAAERLGDFERAAREYQAALQVDADYAGASLALALLYEAQGKYPPALDVVNRYIRRHRGDSEGYALALRLAHRFKRERRVSALTRRLARLPGQEARAVAELGALVAVEVGPAAAIAYIEESALDLSDPSHVAALRVLLEQLARAGSPRRALARIDTSLAAHPEAAGFHALRGEVLERAGRVEAAQTAFERAVALDAREAPALAGLARLAAARGAYEDAFALYARAVAADPESAPIAFGAAALLLERGRLEEAEQSLDLLLYRYPRHAAGAEELAKLLLARHGDLERALDFAQRAVAFGSGSSALETRGRIRLARGEVAEAVEDLTRAAEASPRSASTHYWLGQARLAAGDAEGARAALRAALQFGEFPEATQARAELARLQAAGEPAL